VSIYLNFLLEPVCQGYAGKPCFGNNPCDSYILVSLRYDMDKRELARIAAVVVGGRTILCLWMDFHFGNCSHRILYFQKAETGAAPDCWNYDRHHDIDHIIFGRILDMS
jgi:hypothetical protein